MVRTVKKSIFGVALTGMLVVLVGVAPAFAESEPLVPWWGLSSGARPTVLEPDGSGQIIVTAENRGDGEAIGSKVPVTILDTLPARLKAVAIEGRAGAQRGERGPVVCSKSPATEKPLKCTFAGVLYPYESLEVRISVVVEEPWVPGENTASVSGGGAAVERKISRPVEVGGENRFGVEESQFVPEEVGGDVDTQAGSHPYQLTSVMAFNQTAEAYPIALAKDVSVLTPPGLVGNPTPFAQCTNVQFTTIVQEEPSCPADTIIGVAAVTFNGGGLGYYTALSPIYNMVPQRGEPARFAFYAAVFPVMLDVSVRTGGNYGVTVGSYDTTELGGLVSSRITLWGVPGRSSHDAQRGYSCLQLPGSCTAGGETSSIPPPFLSLPTSCTGPLKASVQIDSWAAPEEILSSDFSEPLASLVGCDQLPFTPSISVVSDVSNASSPTGLRVGVHVSQTAALNPTGNAESTLKNTTVTLPAGVTLNPGGANGLQACSEGEIGFLGKEESEPATNLFTSKLPEPLEPGRNFCPDASKVGTVEIETPLLPNPLDGAVYIASQDSNPFESLFALYLVAYDPVSGTLVKLAGDVELGEEGVENGLAPGQIRTTFKNSPQLPFENLRLLFFGGETATLATPAFCGAYRAVGSFAPWSGEPPVQAFSDFQVTSGPHESACENPLPFSPSLAAGSTNIQAGAFSPFTTTMSREDGNQNLQAISLHMPPGLSGMLSGVTLCGEPQADLGTCGTGSLIGETTVSVGVGNDPLSVTGGKVYLTGPYEGAPFGLSIVNPANAGPFHLGNVIVRAKIEVDPRTSELTVTSDNEGLYKIPSILDGIPLQIKHVNVTINRPGFTFNPTNCAPMAITGSLLSVQGGRSALSVPFHVTNCATLAFKPKLEVSTSKKTSRKGGASLDVKISYPKAPWGSQANIAKFKVDLPRQLPSRLTTLQKACTDAVFNANPAACPAASKVGTATAVTPIIPVPLSGPAYFVSHGGAKFPELIIVLQGYGVTVDVYSETSISKKDITSATVHTVPDVPVNTFELKLPEGPYSALAANGNLCTQKLAMPTTFTAQNGLVIHQSTKISVTGCPKEKAKKATKARKPIRVYERERRNVARGK